MFRSYSNDVIPERSTLRTVFRDTFRSRAISLIVLPLRKCSRRIRPSSPPSAFSLAVASNQSEQRNRPAFRGSILDADPPTQGVKIARRITGWVSKNRTEQDVVADVPHFLSFRGLNPFVDKQLGDLQSITVAFRTEGGGIARGI